MLLENSSKLRNKTTQKNTPLLEDEIREYRQIKSFWVALGLTSFLGLLTWIKTQSL